MLFGRPWRVFALAYFLSQPLAFASNDPAVTDWNNQGVTQARAGKFEEGIASLRHALALDPDDQASRKNLSGILTDFARKQERKVPANQLAQWLEEGAALDPANGPAWVLLGDLRYLKQNDSPQAIQAWQKALPLAPSPVSRALADRIARAERDLKIERGYAAKSTTHFIIRVQEGRLFDLDALGRLLEESYAQLASELGAGPEQLAVIVYTEEALKRVSAQRDWAIGLYDGKLRLRGDELVASLLPDLVRHELAHAFLHRLYGSGLPVWVHEGYAQSHESEQAAALRPASMDAALKARTSWIPLKWLDGHFQQPSSHEDLMQAYAESRLVVEQIIRRQGLAKFKDFLAALQQGQESDTAFDAVFNPWRWSRFEQGIFD